MKFRGVIPRAHFPRNFGGTIVTLVLTGRWGDRHPLIRSTDADPSWHLTGDCFTSRDGENPLDSGCIWGMDVVKPASNRTASQCTRGSSHGQSIGWIDGGAERIEGVGLISQQIGLSHENRNKVSARNLVHRGKQFETNTVTQQTAVVIRGVLERGPAEMSADRDRVRTPKVEDRVSNPTRWAADDSHSNQSIEASSTQEIDDHRFSAVICGVSGADISREHLVTRSAGSGLDIGTGFDVDAMSEKQGSDIARSSSDFIGFAQRVRSQPVIDVNRSDFEISGSSQSKKGERVCASGNSTCNSGSRFGELASGEEIAQERSSETIDEASRFGDGSALVVTAALTSAGITVGSDLLQVPATEGGNSENADNRQNDADPPVPHICRKHGTHRSGLFPVPTSVIGNVEVETFEQSATKVFGNGLLFGSLANVDHE